MTKFMTKEDLSEHAIDLVTNFVGKGCAFVFTVPAGKTIGQHKHKTSHHGVLMLGEVAVVSEGQQRFYTGPHIIHLAAGVAHEIVAIKDMIWACVWTDADAALQAEEVERFTA